MDRDHFQSRIFSSEASPNAETKIAVNIRLDNAKSAGGARGEMSVSLELSHFLRGQFGAVNDPHKVAVS